jgi:hypothetical protein
MAELRREPIARRWVLVTTDNVKGPSDYLSFKPPSASEPKVKSFLSGVIG